MADAFNIWDIIERMADAVKADVAFNAALREQYGELTLYRGINPENLPGENNAPYLAIFAVEESKK